MGSRGGQLTATHGGGGSETIGKKKKEDGRRQLSQRAFGCRDIGSAVIRREEEEEASNGEEERRVELGAPAFAMVVDLSDFKNWPIDLCVQKDGVELRHVTPCYRNWGLA